MKTIYKYPLEIKDQQIIAMTGSWEIISVQNQSGILTIWAIVNPENKVKAEVCIAIYGTGAPMRNINQAYIGTVQMDDGLVWHVFLVH